jgi:uncharacterized repeat protein (TIGR01451 family)
LDTRVRRWVALLCGVFGSWSCTDATEVELLQIQADGFVAGVAYLDLNGNGGLDVADTPLAGVGVILAALGSGSSLAQATTDSSGVFFVPGVPPGTYSLALAQSVLGDSLEVAGFSGNVSIVHGDTARVVLGATYPSLTLPEVRGAAPGRRVFTGGIALNTRLSSGDGVVHFRGIYGSDTTYLRATSVARTTLAIGDSVRLLGTTAFDNGQPTLDAVNPIVLVPAAAVPVAVDVTPGVAETAGNGVLDAALVRIRNAEITDTSTIGGDFHFWAHAGGDSVEVVFREFLAISPSPAIRPDTVVRILSARGVLSPVVDVGGLRWRLLPRAAGDVTTETKFADVAITTSFDPTEATVGETVEIRVTARNVGTTHTATNVTVADTIPTELSFVSYTSTTGAYDQTNGLWTVGDLAPGATADTLRIRVEVVGPAGPVVNRAWFRGLEREVEPTADSNDSASSTLDVS